MSSFFRNKTVLVPFDFSDLAEKAVARVADMADESTKLHVIYILAATYVIAIEPGMMMDLGDDQERIEKSEADLRKRFGGFGRPIECLARIGDPGLEIVDYAKEIEADLIVMPSHGRTGIKRLLLGSVAERTVRSAPCSVMILRDLG